jgi:short-subunit dehydrogenase
MRETRVNGKNIWITGASSGIGEALAKGFAERGANLLLSSRNTAELERAAAGCGLGRAKILPLDLSVPETIPAAAEKAAALLGPADILVSNAGVGQRGLAAETSMEVVRRIFEVNFFGAVALVNAVLPSMRARKSGTILVVSSVLGSLALPGRSAYCASKHALEGYFETLRLELAADNVRVVMARPGWIKTKISQNSLQADGSVRGEPSARKRLMPADECARIIIRGLEQGKEDIMPGGAETWAVHAKRLLPSKIFNSLRRKFGL